jgi:hypothetical protein
VLVKCIPDKKFIHRIYKLPPNSPKKEPVLRVTKGRYQGGKRELRLVILTFNNQAMERTWQKNLRTPHSHIGHIVNESSILKKWKLKQHF